MMIMSATLTIKIVYFIAQISRSSNVNIRDLDEPAHGPGDSQGSRFVVYFVMAFESLQHLLHLFADKMADPSLRADHFSLLVFPSHFSSSEALTFSLPVANCGIPTSLADV